MNVDRKLASIRIVESIFPIEGADSIECLQIDGWKVVSQKGNFQPGDTCVFFEVDSYLPIEPRFEFLRKGCFKNHKTLGEGFRLKTIKLRGQISQGLALPISEFVDVYSGLGVDAGYKEGDDVTELLGVKKWEPDIPKTGGFKSGKAISNFPSFIPKTDQERVQNIYKYIRTDTFEITIKLDGTSMTTYVKDGVLGLCSRNFLIDTQSDCAYTVGLSKFREKFIQYCAENKRNLALQGELMGPGIQGNREQLEELVYFVYDIWDIDKQKYLSSIERTLICSIIGVDMVPVVQYGFKFDKELYSLDTLLKMAENTNSLNTKVCAEGLVFKNHNADFSFKVISNKFLLGEK